MLTILKLTNRMGNPTTRRFVTDSNSQTMRQAIAHNTPHNDPLGLEIVIAGFCFGLRPKSCQNEIRH
jgi:hypothetical protein